MSAIGASRRSLRCTYSGAIRGEADTSFATKGRAPPIAAPFAPEAADFNHFETLESLGNPYGPNGRAALALMKLSSA